VQAVGAWQQGGVSWHVQNPEPMAVCMATRQKACSAESSRTAEEKAQWQNREMAATAAVWQVQNQNPVAVACGAVTRTSSSGIGRQRRQGMWQ